jgi:hypothetical protein
MNTVSAQQLLWYQWVLLLLPKDERMSLTSSNILQPNLQRRWFDHKVFALQVGGRFERATLLEQTHLFHGATEGAESHSTLCITQCTVHMPQCSDCIHPPEWFDTELRC